MYARLGVSVIGGRIKYMDKPIRGENAKALLQSAEMQAIIAPYVAHVAKMGFYPDTLYYAGRDLIIICEHNEVDMVNLRVRITDTEVNITIDSDISQRLNWEDFTMQHYGTKKFFKKAARAKVKKAALKARLVALEAENATLRADIAERKLRPGGEDYEAARERFATQAYE
jgi:hypothetical protein